MPHSRSRLVRRRSRPERWSRRDLVACVSAGYRADRQRAVDAHHRARILLPVSRLANRLLQVGEQLARGNDPVVIGVGFALQSLQEEVREDAVAIAPLGVLEGRLADVAGGNHGALPFGGVALQILVDEVIGALLARAGPQSAKAVAVAGVGKSEHPFCFKYPIKYVLHLP